MRRWTLALLALLAWDAGGASTRPLVIAHRGGSPENRLDAFRRARSLGADGFELDIHLSRDGEIVVIHDDTLDRTFGRPGTVAQMSRAELSAAGVPFLDEVLPLPGTLVIEIKHAGLEEQLVRLLEKTGTWKRSIVISFDGEALKKVHALKPELPTGYLFSLPVDMAATRRELGVQYLGPNYRLVNRQFVEQAHEHGLKVNPWTVNSEKDLRSMVDAGCDAITTDHPELLRPLLR